MDLKKILHKFPILQKKKGQAPQIVKKTNLGESYYEDLINPYDMIFHPSYLETDTKLYDFFLLNNMSGEKKANYLRNLLRYERKTDLSLYFSPSDSSKILDEYKKIVRGLAVRIDKDQAEGKEVDKQMVKLLNSYRDVVTNLEDGNDSYLSYSILFSKESEKTNEEYLSLFQEERELVRLLLKNQVEQPSKFYIPKGQMEEAYISRLPLMEYRLKDWSNISASSGTVLFPFFTETKTPSADDGVPYGINRNTGELLFFNHSKLYTDGYITNRNMNIFWGTGSGKSSFLRSQVNLRRAYGDHFIIFDPKRDYTEMSKDCWGQTISFEIDKPMCYNMFRRSTASYLAGGKKKEVLTIEEKRSNLMNIFKIIAPYLNENNNSSAEFSIAILDSALSKAYSDSPDGSKISLQIFYDTYLRNSIKAFRKDEPDKINSYTEAGERLRANFWNFIEKEDWTKGMYHKMFLPVPEDQEIKLEDNSLITFDLYSLFKDDKIFTVACLIGLEFAWDQVTKKKWTGTDKTIYIAIDENWKLLKYKSAWEYEEAYARLIRGLGWGLYTFSQNTEEYTNTEYGRQILNQAQTNIILKLEDVQFAQLQKTIPSWFTEDVIEDFKRINSQKNSYGTGYINQRGRMQPFKYLYLPEANGRDTWQEKKSWKTSGADYQEGFEVK